MTPRTGLVMKPLDDRVSNGVWIRGVPPLHTPPSLPPRYLASLRGHVSAVYQIAWSADSRLLCSGSSDSTLKAMTHYMFMFVSQSCDYHVTVMCSGSS